MNKMYKSLIRQYANVAAAKVNVRVAAVEVTVVANGGFDLGGLKRDPGILVVKLG